MANPTLSLEALLTIPSTVVFPIKETKLGDGYEQVGGVGSQDSFTNYAVTSKYLPLVDASTLLQQMLNWRGIQAFFWSPDIPNRPLKLFVCKQWQWVLVDEHTRQFSGTFEEVIK